MGNGKDQVKEPNVGSETKEERNTLQPAEPFQSELLPFRFHSRLRSHIQWSNRSFNLSQSIPSSISKLFLKSIQGFHCPLSSAICFLLFRRDLFRLTEIRYNWIILVHPIPFFQKLLFLPYPSWTASCILSWHFLFLSFLLYPIPTKQLPTSYPNSS